MNKYHPKTHQMSFSKHHSSMFHISALPSAGPRFSAGGGGGIAVAVDVSDGGAVPEDLEVALEEEEPVESRTEEAVTRVLVADAAVFIVLERFEVAPVDRLELFTVLAVEMALEEEEPVERREDDDTPVDRLTLLAVLAVEVGFEEEEPVERRTDDAEDEVTRVPVADTAVFSVLVRFEEVPPVERLTLLAVLPVENGFEEEEPVERRMDDDREDEVTRVPVADTAVFVLVRFEVTPVERLTLRALLPVENGFEEAVELRLAIAEGENFVDSPVLNVIVALVVDLVPELALIDSLDAVPVLKVMDGLDETVELRMIVAEDDLVDIPVLNVMDDLIVEVILELALRDGLDVAPDPELALIEVLDVIPVLELALIDGLELTPDPELTLIEVLDVTPVLELALIDSLDDTLVPRDRDGVDESPVRRLLGVVRTRVLKLAEGLEEVPELKGGFDDDAVPKDAEGLEEVPELNGGFDEDPVLSDTVGLLETPVLSLRLVTDDLEEKPVLSDTETLEETPVLSDTEDFEDEPVLSDAEGLDEKPVLSGGDEDLEAEVVERVETVRALEELGVTVIVGVISMHEQMVLMNCGSCVRQDAHIDELAALSVGEAAVMVFLSFLPDLSSSRFSRSSAVTVTAAMGKLREQYASAGG